MAPALRSIPNLELLDFKGNDLGMRGAAALRSAALRVLNGPF